MKKEREMQAYNCKQKLFNTSLKSNSWAKSLWISKKIESLFVESRNSAQQTRKRCSNFTYWPRYERLSDYFTHWSKQEKQWTTNLVNIYPHLIWTTRLNCQELYPFVSDSLQHDVTKMDYQRESIWLHVSLGKSLR